MYLLMDKVKSLIMNLMAHNYRSLTPAHKGPSHKPQVFLLQNLNACLSSITFFVDCAGRLPS